MESNTRQHPVRCAPPPIQPTWERERAGSELFFSTEHRVVEVLRARRVIEGEIAFVAARVRTHADIQQVHAALAAIRDTKDHHAATEATDRLFHVRIAEATGNDVLTQMVGRMWDGTSAMLCARIKSCLNAKALQRVFYDDYAGVLDALVAQDCAMARDVMRSHIDHVMNEIRRAARPP